MGQEVDRLIALFKEHYPWAVEEWLEDVHTKGVWSRVCSLAEARVQQDKEIDVVCLECGVSDFSLADREYLWCRNGGVERFRFAECGLCGYVTTEAWNAFAFLVTVSDHARMYLLINGYIPSIEELWNEGARGMHQRLELRFAPIRPGKQQGAFA